MTEAQQVILLDAALEVCRNASEGDGFVLVGEDDFAALQDIVVEIRRGPANTPAKGRRSTR